MQEEREQAYSLALTRPIVLVGLMGAGKTSVGRRLAEALGVDFRDSDLEIEAAAGLSVGEIFDKFGEAYFRSGEQKVIARLLGEAPGVLATGGGAFMNPEIREIVGKRGVSVWLDADVETLWQRVKDRSTRPLLQQENPRAVLETLDAARRPIYGQADLRVHSEPNQSHDLMVARILKAIVAADKQAGTAAGGSRPPVLVKTPRKVD